MIQQGDNMYLSRLIVKNYRSIRYLNIPFSRGKNIILGKNNAGKSNIIKALNMVLGEKYPTYINIDDNDFFCNEDHQENYFYIIAKLSGNDIDEESILNSKGFWSGPLIENPLSIDEETSEVNILYNHIFFEPDEYYEGTRGLKNYHKSTESKIDWIRNIKDQSIYFVFYVAKYRVGEEEEYFKDLRMLYQINDKWFASWNLSKQIRDSFLTSAIIDSFRDTSSQLRINHYSWYGRLIKRIWDEKKGIHADDGVTLEQKILERFQEVKYITQDVFNDVASTIQDVINTSFDDTHISFQMAIENRADIHKGTHIYIDDGFESHISDKGSGIQSAVIINLFSYFCYLFHKNTSLLAIEEPELYLHPQARRALSNKLDEFIHLTQGKENQIILTTHSTEFISAGNIANGIIIVKKEARETKAVYYSFRDIETKELQTLLKNENNEMFFADNVILVEGAEKYLIPHIADFFGNNILDNRNISVIRVGGKGDFHKYFKILKKCNINRYIIADRDYLFNGIKNIFEYTNISDTQKGMILDFVNDVNRNSIGDYKRMRKIQEKTIMIEQSIDARKLCEALEKMSINQDGESMNEVINIWEYIKPSVRKKDIDGYLESNGLYDKFNYIRDMLWENNIYILSKGELEDYFTSQGQLVQGTKEEKVINIIRNISPENQEPLSYFMDTTEYTEVLSKVLDMNIEEF